ncbi:YlzJ-like family protein [Salibacterium aidingense]|uniref:YlzJ-like family protein n=1 Tax=Salibacterium aidingense TaxID=384933 RepID=UPI0004118E54|nr:YlzJ-like family protein [Salibacterium aidingense]
MILYTPLAAESIFPPDEKEWKEQQTAAIEHGCVTIQKSEEGEWTIVSLNSSNPHDYMQPHLQPGVKWKDYE